MVSVVPVTLGRFSASGGRTITLGGQISVCGREDKERRRCARAEKARRVRRRRFTIACACRFAPSGGSAAPAGRSVGDKPVSAWREWAIFASTPGALLRALASLLPANAAARPFLCWQRLAISCWWACCKIPPSSRVRLGRARYPRSACGRSVAGGRQTSLNTRHAGSGTGMRRAVVRVPWRHQHLTPWLCCATFACLSGAARANERRVAIRRERCA